MSINVNKAAADLVTFTEEIINGKLHLLWSVFCLKYKQFPIIQLGISWCWVYKFTSTYLFLFLSITTYKTLSSYRVSGQLMQNNYRQVKILGGGKLEYYKLMKGTTQKRGRNFEISVAGSKRKEHDF